MEHVPLDVLEKIAAFAGLQGWFNLTRVNKRFSELASPIRMIRVVRLSTKQVPTSWGGEELWERDRLVAVRDGASYFFYSIYYFG